MTHAIELSCGYKSLSESIQRTAERYPNDSRFSDGKCSKLKWAVERAKHYEEITGVSACMILDTWEANRDYWYVNYYQDANQPRLDDKSVRVFDTIEDMKHSIGTSGFRCPRCKGVSTNPKTCDSGEKIEKGKICDWKSWGLFGTMGQGVHIFVKTECHGQDAFTPISWEITP